MRRHVRTALLALVSILLSAGVAGAAEAPTGTFVYNIRHQTHGEIGTLTIVSKHEGGNLVFDEKLRIAVKVMFVTAYREESDRREAWHDGRLVAYDANTNLNGKKTKITAHAEGDHFIIKGPDGRIVAPASVFPSNPFNPDIVHAKVLMDTTTGKLLHVTVTPAGEETITAAGGPIKAQHYVISGEMHRDLWFGESGKLLKFSLKKEGALVTFTLR